MSWLPQETSSRSHLQLMVCNWQLYKSYRQRTAHFYGEKWLQLHILSIYAKQIGT